MSDPIDVVNPTIVSAIIFLCIFGGAMLGMYLRAVLPAEHLDGEIKDLIKLGAGLVGTMAALLLGLQVASAKSSYDAQRGELIQIAANTILLDRELAHYGPETHEVRRMLKAWVERTIDLVWAKDPKAGELSPLRAGGDVIFEKIQELQPHSETQRSIQSLVESTLINLGQARLLLFEQSGSSISIPFLAVVVFWLSTLFVSFGIFSPPKVAAVITLLVSAISVAGALFLILELDHPFSGLIEISRAPLVNALTIIGR